MRPNFPEFDVMQVEWWRMGKDIYYILSHVPTLTARYNTPGYDLRTSATRTFPLYPRAFVGVTRKTDPKL